MTPTELHAAVHAAVTTRLELARFVGKCTGETWDRQVIAVYMGGGGQYRIGAPGKPPAAIFGQLGPGVAEFIADPAATIRACEADLERLATHNPAADIIAMHWGGCPCAFGKACPELLRMAKAYAITIEPDERAAISRQWAADWNSPDDTTYDQPEPATGPHGRTPNET